MSTGTVKFFNETKGFGFIKPSDGGKDLFVHKSDVEGSIRDDDQVEFEVTSTPKGPAATSVKRV